MTPTTAVRRSVGPSVRHMPAILALFALSCGGPNTQPITELPRALTSDEAALVAADNSFAFRLFGAIAARDSVHNLFISPLSVSMALGMAYNGAAGTTADAMRQTLGFGSLGRDQINASYRSLIDLLRGLDAQVDFAIANSVWHRQEYTLDSGFLERVRQSFDATVQPLDFASADAAPTINQWVSDATHARITEIVDAPIPADIIAYLINAIYFKGTWTYQFSPDRTFPETFYLADGSTRSVPMMHSKDDMPVRYAFDGQVHVADLAYGGGAYRMTVVLPLFGIDSLVGILTQDRWNQWVGALDSMDVPVAMPKFQLQYERSLPDVLSALGMGEAFCGPNTTADFTAMYPPGGLCISDVKHKTWLEVNEEGTEAAAVTSVEVGVTSAGPSIILNRPFLFAIREAYSGTILFMGRIMEP